MSAYKVFGVEKGTRCGKCRNWQKEGEWFKGVGKVYLCEKCVKEKGGVKDV